MAVESALYNIARNLTGLAMSTSDHSWNQKHPQSPYIRSLTMEDLHRAQLGQYHYFATMLILWSVYSWSRGLGSSQYAAGSSINQKSSVKSGQRSTNEQPATSTVISSADMKRSDSNYFPDDSDDDDIRRYEPQFPGTSNSGSVPGRLACPYFKRSPQIYQSCQSCRGPGWRSVHHVKGHLYRRHRRQPQCTRCYLTFNDLETLNAHQKMPRCEIKDGILGEGFDHDQEKKLRSRKRRSIKSSEAERWKEMYQILFPNDDPSTIPSPYYDEEYSEKPEKWSNPNITNPLVDFATYCERQLPVLLGEHFSQSPLSSRLPEHIKAELINIVRNSQAKLLPMYQQMQSNQNPFELSSFDTTNDPIFSLPPAAPRFSPTLPIGNPPPSQSTQIPQLFPPLEAPVLEEEPGLSFSDASKSSSSDSLETLAAGIDTGLEADILGSFESWVLQKPTRASPTAVATSSTPSNPAEVENNALTDIDMSDFVDFDAGNGLFIL